MKIEKLVKKEVRRLRAYEAKEIPCRVKLDANESPFDHTELLKTLKGVSTNRYPDPEARALRREAAKRWRVRTGQILPGNGSDELIYYLITTFGGPVLFPEPTFSMYGIIGRALGVKVVGVKLDRDFDLNIKKMEDAIRRYRPKIVFLSIPNNPTGNCFSSERVLRLSRVHKGILVIDEAYHLFSSRNGYVPLLKDMDNLVIMRTLSKIGFAGLRTGFLIGREELIKEVNKVRLPFNVNSLSQRVALEAFRGYPGILKEVDKVITERERLYGELQDTEGVRPYPSEANFILFQVKDGARVWKALLKEGVLVRDMTSTIRDALRVTVGLKEENEFFLNALRRVLKKGR